MKFANFDLDIAADAIAIVTWDMPGRSINVIDAAVTEELTAIVELIVAEPAVKGVVITSGKDTFCAGADFTALERLGRIFNKLAATHGEEAAQAHVFEESRRFSLLCRRIETCGKPWVAALNGTAIGGGFELALACHHRIAADITKTRLALPEIKVGLLPGGGGTQRIARMLEPADALRFLLKGEQINVGRAKSMKLVDAVVPLNDLVNAAKHWIATSGEMKAPWDIDGFKPPGPPVHSKAGMMMFMAANALYRQRTFDNYPAARAIMQVVYEGLQLPMDQALRVESRWFVKILRSPEAAAMVRSLFVSLQEINKGARRPAAVPRKNLKKIGVLGAGSMGAGIAHVSALAGLDVVLVDRDAETAEKGKQHSQTLMTDDIARGRAVAADRDALLARIKPTADYVALKECDLVIDAVSEDRKVKEEAIRRAQNVIGDEAIFGSNTSTLSITSLASSFKNRAHFIGIRFFSPVERMMLVEVVLGKDTGDASLAVALDYVRAIRKTPIVVNDSPGFYASRVVGTYLREGHLLLREGVPAAMIENVGRLAGMPFGPLALSDEVAVVFASKSLLATEADLGPEAIDTRQKTLLEEMVEKHGRLGRKNGKGFYDYPQSGPKRLWPGLAALQPYNRDPESIDVAELMQRLLAIQALESARCIEEGVVTDIREADVGSILGFGFAPFTGGTISYIDGMGVKAFVGLCDTLAERYGHRFTPCKLLRDMVKADEAFYCRFAPIQGQAES